MPVEIIENFHLGTDIPLDNRYVVNTKNDVSLYWYPGMQVFQTSDKSLEWFDGSLWHTSGSSSPLTTKGDIFVYSDQNTRLPIGSPGQLLMPDPSSAFGLDWVDSSTGYGYFTYWAEESSSPTAGAFEWSYGNGDEAPSGSGMMVGVDCELFGIGTIASAASRFTVRIYKTGADTGAVSDTMSSKTKYTLLSSPVSFSTGDIADIKTEDVSTSDSAGIRTALFFRYKFDGLKGDKGETGDCSINTTDDLPEGSTNLYCTDQRIEDYLISESVIREASIGDGFIWDSGQLDVSISGSVGLYAYAKTLANGSFDSTYGLTVTNSATGTYDYTFNYSLTNNDYGVIGQPFNSTTDTNIQISNVTNTGFKLEIGRGDNGTTPDVLVNLDHTVMVLGPPTEMGLGVSRDYVDGSLATRDTSIVYNTNKLSSLDASIVDINAYQITQDNSIVANTSYLGSLDASIVDINTQISSLDNSIAFNTSKLSSLDASIVDINAYQVIQDTSIITNTNQLSTLDASIVDINSQISSLDASIVDINSQISSLDASIVDINAYQVIQDTSIITNTSQIASLDASIVDINAYQIIQDNSIIANTSQIASLDASIVDINAYQIIQDNSIIAIESSLGDYVKKSGDIMTGNLKLPDLTLTHDISIIGSIYLGDTSDGGQTIETDLLAVVTESGKIVATSIPASNSDTTVKDVSTSIDVSILSGIYYVDTTGGNVTLTIPDNSSTNDGKLFGILKKSADNNSVIVTTQSGVQSIGSLPIQTITQRDKGFTVISDYDNDKWLITQDSRYLEGNTQGEFQFWDVSTSNWKPTSSDITWNDSDLHFTVGGNSTPATFKVDASSDIVYINANDLTGLSSADNLGFYAGGRGAYGNEVTIDRLRANVPGNVPRALSLIDTHAVMRIWRYVDDTNDPAVEFVWGKSNAPGDASNNWWDMFLDGDPNGNDSFSIRSRTVPYGNLKLLTVFRDHTQIESTTESYDPSSGSLQTYGGAGISGNIYSKGSINPGGSEVTSAFPDVSTGGEMFYRADLNQMFLYDASRGKWLSIDRATYTAGSNKITSSTTGYMDVGQGTMSSKTGFRMPKNGTILGATVQNRSNVSSSRQMTIRINNTISYTLTIPVSNPGGAVGNNGNVDFSKDDIIQIVLESGGSTMRDIQASFEVAWRE